MIYLHKLTKCSVIERIAIVRQIIEDNKYYLLRKYLPTCLLFLFSAYIYSLLRGVKDSILVPALGAELISFIKFYGVFPATVAFFICFSKLANILARDKLYFCITGFFISFFLIYAFFLGPNQHYIHPNMALIIQKFPHFKFQIMMIENWSTTVFYIMSELCGTVLLTLLFWQLANDIYNIKEAKKTYASFGLIGQTGLVVAGFVQHNVSSYFLENTATKGEWDETIKWLMVSIFVSGLILMFIYNWICQNVISDTQLCDRKHNAKNEKVSLSIKDSFRYVFSSKYLWLIMVIVFCYGVGVNMIEIVWKSQLRIQYQNENSYSAFIGKFHIYFGCVTIFVMLFGTYILRKFKWIVPALFTPVGAGMTGIVFFSLIIFQDFFKSYLDDLNLNILSMAVFFGSTQVILFKSFNYAFVDSTKEMAFIPLDRELRVKGKAAVDVIGGRFGKAFGAILQQFMFHFISPNLQNLTMEIFFIFVITMFLWLFAVICLNREFSKFAHE